MPGSRSDNLDSLRRWAAEAHRGAAVEAVKAGQGVIAAGLRRRAPGRVAATVRVTRVGSNREFVGGFVMVTHPRAAYVERRRPFVGPTFAADGPRAERAMLETLRRLIR